MSWTCLMLVELMRGGVAVAGCSVAPNYSSFIARFRSTGETQRMPASKDAKHSITRQISTKMGALPFCPRINNCEEIFVWMSRRRRWRETEGR